MSTRGTITLTVGPPGSGKSYKRCARFLVDEFLPFERGTHYSNFPIGKVEHDPAEPGETYMDRIAKAVVKAHGGTFDQYRRRMKCVPLEELKKWRESADPDNPQTGEHGPWEWFKDEVFEGAHIAIDEVHNYCGTGSSRKNQRRWLQWLGEVRHEGATVELLSQQPGKIYSKIINDVETKYVMVNSAMRRDPITGVLTGDWYELRSGMLKVPYKVSCWQIEYRLSDTSWVEERRQKFALEPYYFRFYDSYVAAQLTGKKGKRAQRPHEFMSRGQLLRWFGIRNGFTLLPRVALVAFMAWFTIGGGGGKMVRGFVGTMTGAVASNVSGSSDVVTAGEAAADPRRHHEQTEHEQVAIAELDNNSEQATARRELVTIIEAQRIEMVRLREALEQQEQSRADRALIGISRQGNDDIGEIIMADGRRYKVGDTISRGHYEGQRVLSINWLNREARLEDGTVISVRRRNGDDIGLHDGSGGATPQRGISGGIRGLTGSRQ